MNYIIDYYFNMANGFLHIFEILFLVSLFIIFKRRENKLNHENKVRYFSKVNFVLFIFMFIVLVINIYLVYEIFNSKFYLDISPTSHGIYLYFKGFKDSLFPFLLSQLVVSALCCIFYIWIHLKQKHNIKKLMSAK